MQVYSTQKQCRAEAKNCYCTFPKSCEATTTDNRGIVLTRYVCHCQDQENIGKQTWIAIEYRRCMYLHQAAPYRAAFYY